MKSIYVTLFLIFFLYTSQLLSNELKNATSPYLLQHADNPVNWMPWGVAAFQKAKQEKKAVFLSIGYSTCHWCHVMEQESFTDKKLATLLNRYFVPIKVDREEMPQIDAYYQRVYQNYTGRIGGWPLSVFMTPDKKPFFITTYIPPKKRSYAEGMDTLLLKEHKIYQDKQALYLAIVSLAKKEKKELKRDEKSLSLKELQKSMQRAYDTIYEGFGRGKKFPEASKIELMLDLAALLDDKELSHDAFSMLDTMALRGLYDHVDGGFFRYCVDAAWEIPHFEKMLYNQAELISLYTRAYLLSRKKLYKKIVDETIGMLEKRFEKEDLFWSASDADSEEQEGAYYLFSMREIAKALQNNSHKKEIESALDMFENGNFQGKEHLNFYTKDRPKGFGDFRKKLQQIREKRVFPFIDKKINTAWNAMVIEALFQASVIDKKYREKAEKSLQKLEDQSFFHGQLYHQAFVNRKVQQKGLLEDYAFFIGALIVAYECDYNEEHLEFAYYLLREAKRKFYKNGIWYLNEEGEAVAADLNDKYYTSAESKMMQDIIKLAALKGSFKDEKLFLDSLKKRKRDLLKEGINAPAYIRAYLMDHEGIIVLKSSQKNLEKNRSVILQNDYPYLLTKAKPYSDYLACNLRQCFIKEQNITAVMQKVLEYKKYPRGE